MIKKLKNMKLYHKMALGFTLVGMVLALVVLITVFQVSSLMLINERVVNMRVPTARASLMMLNGMNHSLAALRGWIILGEDSFTKERQQAWEVEIEPSFQALQTFSKNWTNPENVAHLQTIGDVIQDFKRYQQEIEEIAQKDANIPALEMLFRQAAPQAEILAKQITIMIELEAGQAGTPQRKILLGIMDDVYETTELGLAAIRTYLLSGESKFRQQFEALWIKNSRRFADLEKFTNLLSAEQRSAFYTFSKARLIFDPLPPQMFALRESDDWNRANHWLKVKAAPVATKIIEALDDMAASQKELMAVDLKTQEEMENSLFSLLWVLLACGLTACVILGVLISRSVVGPMMVVVNNLNDMSHGTSDLTKRLPVSAPVCSDIEKCGDTSCPCYGKGDVSCWEIRGSLSFAATCPTLESGTIKHCEECDVYKQATYSEMQALSVNFNSFICKLQMILLEVVKSVNTVSAATRELSTISDTMSAGAQHVSAQSDSVSVAAEEMSTNMNSVAAASEEATTNITIVASAAEEMTVSIADVNKSTSQASKVTGEAVTEAESATAKVQELGHAASEISKVTEVITEISNQTNLLALNATIEAARAGEAGKGFAVVANEIKDLAKQTAEATGQIKNKIDGIQSSTSATVHQIERITIVINDINETVQTISVSVDGQATATDEIASNVAEAAHGLEEVNENVVQSSVVSDQIARDITMVSESSTEISNSSNEVKNSADMLSESAEKLKEMTAGFKL